ncbi:hypothetical protein D6779_01550 [Candidatus Parcubacteria bacterium]|nr:MAG: hypothetical protein D6779_01550 [Candidatus Parcubacteria bacterium]
MPRAALLTATCKSNMKGDTLVVDIETKNFFTDPDVGWNNFGALQISVVCVYSYAEDRYMCFEEDEHEKLADIFRRAHRIVGFSSNRFDVPVLQHYFRRAGYGDELNLWAKERVDLLVEIESAIGSRVSLNLLAFANLGVGKSGKGSEAIQLYRSGRIEELKKYCARDVWLTKELYDLYRTRGRLLVPEKRTGELIDVPLRRPAADR